MRGVIPEQDTKLVPSLTLQAITSVLPHEIAEEFNSYFVSVFSIEDTSNVPSADKLFHGTESEELHEIPVTGETVYLRH